MPPVKLYENTSKTPLNAIKDNKDMLALANEDAELEEENKTKKSFGNPMDHSTQGLATSKSPHKSLAIKGPPKIIQEFLEIDNYKGVKVTDINVRPVIQSVA